MFEAVRSAAPKELEERGHCDACFSGKYPIEFRPGTISSLRRVVN
jgi:sorbitol-specific phosphotransferase system component IIA